ncbi:MAG TPA: hypothetical protein VFS21_15655, partial [Roseiflexaceae bacterium]|nr:hypothetical protein [Roseiflexaceae bacterium]
MTTRDLRPTGQPELAHIRSRLAALLRLYGADLPAEQVDVLARVLVGLMGMPDAARLSQLQASLRHASVTPLPELLQAQLQQLAGQLAALGSQDAAPPADAASTWPLPRLCLWRSAPGNPAHYAELGDLTLLQQDADGRYRMQLEVRPGAPAEVVRAALSTDPDLRIWLDMRRVEHPASRLALALTLRHPAPIAGYRWSCSFQLRVDAAHARW